MRAISFDGVLSMSFTKIPFRFDVNVVFGVHLDGFKFTEFKYMKNMQRFEAKILDFKRLKVKISNFYAWRGEKP